MKKWLILLSLLITLTGCSVQNEGPVLKDPPTLTVVCGEQKITAPSGSFSWEYQNGDGTTTSSIGDGIHPLDSKDHAATLETDAATATLQFGVEPQRILVEYWSDAHWGDTAAKSSYPNLDGNQLSLRKGGFIYYIHASWDTKRYSGSCSYTVYVISSAEEPILTAPPQLTVKSGGKTVTAKLGTYTWTYRTEENTTATTCADGSHPLMMLTAEDCLETEEASTYLRFEVPPDRMESFCWYDTELGKSDAYAGVSIDDYWAGYRIDAANGGMIFSIHAFWEDREGYEGDAWYCFYQDKKKVEQIFCNT